LRWLKKWNTDNQSVRKAVCAIDLDTMPAACRFCKQYKVLLAYDAHELFTELTEVKRRPLIQRIWKSVEQYSVPKITLGYSVNTFIANYLENKYNKPFEVIRNLPLRKKVGNKVGPAPSVPILPERFFLYQGAVNEGRGFDTLIPAMKMSPLPLVIAGDGNYMQAVKDLVTRHGLSEKVMLLGMLPPGQLAELTPKAFAGITIFENSGLNQYYSLANRFFDYIRAGIPQICIDYPKYRKINDEFGVALMTESISEESLAAAMNKLFSDPVLYRNLQQQTQAAAEELCWEKEEQKLIRIWNHFFPI